VLVETARGDFALSVRRAAAKGLGCIDWEKLGVEERGTAQAAAIAALEVALVDPEWVVRYASVVGLAGIAIAQQSQSQDITRLKDKLKVTAREDSEGVVRARAQLAFMQI
jgi:phycocyanobilin lyase beta subunit